MNIVFFGSAAFSVKIIEGILSTDHTLSAIVCQPDKVNGRNGKVEYSPVKKFALAHDIPLYQFKRLNKEGEQTLRDLAPDIIVTASYGQIIKQNILDIPKYAIYNVHASLLPKYRGSAPIQWAVINGDKTTGVSIMKTELGIDCGEVYLKKSIEISEEDTASSMFEKLSTLGKDCIVEFLDKFDILKNQGVPQDESLATHCRMLDISDECIDFDDTAVNVANKIKGMDMEGSYFVYKGVRYKVYFAKISNFGTGVAGTILSAKPKVGLHIATRDGAVQIIKIQPQGKKIMDAKDFLNGCKFIEGDRVENII